MYYTTKIDQKDVSKKFTLYFRNIPKITANIINPNMSSQ